MLLQLATTATTAAMVVTAVRIHANLEVKTGFVVSLCYIIVAEVNVIAKCSIQIGSGGNNITRIIASNAFAAFNPGVRDMSKKLANIHTLNPHIFFKLKMIFDESD